MEHIGIIVELVSFVAAFFWAERRYGRNIRTALVRFGIAFATSGTCSYVGAKYFGFAIMGKTFVATGADAARISGGIAIVGCGLVLLHCILSRLFPAAMRVPFGEEKKGPTKGQSRLVVGGVVVGLIATAIWLVSDALLRARLGSNVSLVFLIVIGALALFLTYEVLWVGDVRRRHEKHEKGRTSR